MRNRRQFLKDAAGASAVMFFLGNGSYGSQANAQAPQTGAVSKRREIRIGQRRIKTVDVHSHVALPEAAEVLKGTPLEKLAAGGPTRPGTDPHSLGPVRLQTMDEMGIDVQVVSINAFWYSAERDLARRLIDVQNQKLAELCAVHPDRFVALASVALQFPETRGSANGRRDQAPGNAWRGDWRDRRGPGTVLAQIRSVLGQGGGDAGADFYASARQRGGHRSRFPRTRKRLPRKCHWQSSRNHDFSLAPDF